MYDIFRKIDFVLPLTSSIFNSGSYYVWFNVLRSLT